MVDISDWMMGLGDGRLLQRGEGIFLTPRVGLLIRGGSRQSSFCIATQVVGHIRDDYLRTR